jgi:alkanesulfonate monooxygenase SsuD/methylene tetrahydromethanopterin reductase-like flavin-dependent oxidoreductase (luciferase family)
MEFGVFDHLDRGGLPLRDYYEARLKLIEAYDRAGFYAYHVAEHHATPLGMAPSPSIFLAAAAQRTRRLRLGTLVYALPLHHPLRMIEEICMLDHLSRGRLDMGFGRGSSPIELEYYGQDPEDAPQAYAEALKVVLAGLAQKVLDAETRALAFKDVPMELAPLQRPHPPLWYGVHSTDSAERAARLGSNIACNEPADASAAYIERYWSVWREAQGDRAYRVDAFSAANRKATSPENAMEPKAGVTQFVVVADSDDAALAIAHRAYLVWHKSFHHLFRRHGRVAKISGGEADFDELSARGKGIAGTPDTVLRFLTARLGKTGANYCINRFAFGDLSLAESLRSVELFVRDVQPALQHT